MKHLAQGLASREPRQHELPRSSPSATNVSLRPSNGVRSNLAQNNVTNGLGLETPVWSASSPLDMREGDMRLHLVLSGTRPPFRGELASQD